MGAALAAAIGVTTATVQAGAAPSADYAREVKRLEQDRTRADSDGALAKVFAIDEALLRVHLGALGPPGIAGDPVLDAASSAIQSLLDDCATDKTVFAELDRLFKRPNRDDPAVVARVQELLDQAQSQAKQSPTIDTACVAREAQHISTVVEASLQTEDPRRLDLLERLGSSLAEQGGIDAAAPVLDRVLTKRVARLEPGDESADFAFTAHFSEVAWSCRHQTQPACHNRLVQPAIARLEKQLGNADARVAAVLQAVGEMYLVVAPRQRPSPEQLARARDLLERALAVEERSWAKQGDGLHRLPYPLIGVYLLQGDHAAILALARRTDAHWDGLEGSLLTSGDEKIQRIGAVLALHATDEAISLHLTFAPSSTELARHAFEAILRRKGRIVETQADLIAAARASTGLDLQGTLALQAHSNAWLALQAAQGGAPKGSRPSTAIAGDPAPPRVPPSVEEIRGALAEGEALVELIVYRPLEPALLLLDSRKRRAADESRDGYGAPRYAAYAVARSGEIVAIDLGDAKAIDAAAAKLRAALADEKIDPALAARALDTLTMARIRPLVGSARRLLLSPDGALALVPFAALVDERGRYLIEDWSFRYLSSGRDAAHGPRATVPRGAPVIVGDPAFDAALVVSADRGTRAPDRAGVRFPSLPGTLVEAKDIAAMFRSAELLLGDRASEAALKALHGPAVLHLATHGFFAPDASVSLDLRNLDNGENLADPAKTPMLRAGLALAGANRPHATGGDDGVLTALEVSSLDLAGTRLVVLSACETGLGDASPGEGVYGLRRALTLAGAETLVMSLWRVPDSATRDLMTAFYGELRGGSAPSTAMRKVALAMLADGRAHPRTSSRAHPRFWAGFIVSGDDVPLPVAWAPSIAPPPASPGPRGCACSAAIARSPSAAPLLLAAIAVTLRRRRHRRRRAARGASSPSG